MSERTHRIILMIVLALIVAVRLIGIDYGLPQIYKADEFDASAALKLLTTRDVMLGPRVVYPPLSAYLYALLLVPFLMVHYLWQGCPSPAEFSFRMFFSLDQVWLWWRLCGIGIHLLTLGFLYRLVRRVFDRETALFAVILVGFSLAQFKMTTIAKHWTFTYPLTAMAMYYGLDLQHGIRNYLFTGIIAALGFGNNFFSLSLIAIPVLNHCYFRYRLRQPLPHRHLAAGLLVFIMGCAAIYLLHPYPYGYDNMNIQAGLHNYRGNLGQSVQAVADKMVKFWMVMLVYDYTSVALGVGGLALLLYRRQFYALVVLAYPLIYCLFAVFGLHMIQPRYESPTTLGMSVVGAVLVAQAWSRRRSAGGAALLVLVFFLLAISLMHIGTWAALLNRDDTRTLLDRYVVEHIPPGTRIVIDLPGYNLVPAAVYPTRQSITELTARGFYSRPRFYYLHLLAIPENRYAASRYYLYEVPFGTIKDFAVIDEQLRPDYLIVMPRPTSIFLKETVTAHYEQVAVFAPAPTPADALDGDGRNIESLPALRAVTRLGPWIEVYRRR